MASRKTKMIIWLAICLCAVFGERVLAQDAGTYFPISPKKNFTESKVAIKTNLLGDMAWLPNIGLEIPLAEKWSLQGTYYHIWLADDPAHEYWRIYGGDIEGRYWLREALLGHHFGLYAQVFTYDFEFGGDGMQGRKPQFGAGLSYGWSYPVADRLSVDFSFGVGFVTGEYDAYTPCDGCYLRQHTKRLRYFGPTKAAISLVYHIK